jgi:DNA-binding transcriptional MocR family regulator
MIIDLACYTGALAALYPLEPNMLTVPIDKHGIIPSELEKTIKDYYANPKSTPIKFIYLVPTGHNPSGATMTVERKKAIYALAKKYNFLILVGSNII